MILAVLVGDHTVLKKRIIGVVTVRNGLVVQSFGYRKYLPVGKPEIIVENLDRWGVDEIFVQVIDRSINCLKVDLDFIGSIKSRNISTPIIYAGGVSSAAEAVDVVQSGADRICVDALLHTNPEEIENISYQIGAQAVIASLPIMIGKEGQCCWYNYITKKTDALNKRVLGLFKENIVSEIIVIDCQNEGVPGSFNFNLLSMFSELNNKLILFGGLSSVNLLKKALLDDRVSAVAIGNFLNYREHTIQEFKEQLALPILRSPLYQDRLSQV